MLYEVITVHAVEHDYDHAPLYRGVTLDPGLTAHGLAPQEYRLAFEPPTAAERVMAQMALAELPLTTFLEDLLVPYEQDEVTRLSYNFV